MKFFYIFICFCILGFEKTHSDTANKNCLEYSIVFIHIGNQLPTHLETAMMQARLFNSDATIYLIANKSAYNAYLMSAHKKTLDFCKSIFISCESLTPSIQHVLFNKRSVLDKTFRNGFWQYATERFFYLEELISRYDLINVFHLESDVMLYTNLQDSLPIFSSLYKGIAATFDNDCRVIPGFVYINDFKSIHELSLFLLQNAFSGKSDMSTLADFKNVQNGAYIDHLPIIFSQYTKKYALKSASGHHTNKQEKFFNHYDKFLSIFDAAALGQYLGGIDPRNYISPTGFINESCLFNPSYLTFEWIKDEQGRKIPFAIFEKQKIKINNLHIHSKNLNDFYSGNLESLTSLDLNEEI